MTANPPTFVAWLRDRHRDDTPIGDLARDWINSAEPGRRRGSTPHAVRDVLNAHSAIDGAYEALDDAARQWQQQTGQTPVGMPRYDDE